MSNSEYLFLRAFADYLKSVQLELLCCTYMNHGKAESRIFGRENKTSFGYELKSEEPCCVISLDFAGVDVCFDVVLVELCLGLLWLF